MSGLSLTWFAVSFLLGALLAAPLAPDGRATVLCAAVVAAAFIRNEARHIRALALAALVAATLYTSIRTQSEPNVRETRTQRFAGTIVARSVVEDGLREYQLRLDRSYTVRFAARQEADVGTHAIVRGRLEPFDGPRNPGEPSERNIEREAGITAQIQSATILAVDTRVRPPLDGEIARVKAWALEELRSRLGDPAAEIVAGELWGERAAMPPDLHREFQETGTVHVLVTAGLHIGLIAALIVAMGAALGAPRAAVCVVAIAGVWIFAFLSGLHVPAMRAAVMTTMALAARAAGRAAMSWNSLAAAAIVVLLVAPLDVISASFWLSFCCISAIFSLAPALHRKLESALPNPTVREALVLTLATQIGTWPITAAVFLQFTPYAVLANLAVVPCVPLTMALGAAQLVTSLCAPLAQAFANLNSWILAWMIGAVRMLGTAPVATIVTTPAPVWALAAYEATIAGTAWLVRRGASTAALGLILAATSYVLWPPRPLATHTLRITVLDVGQADAIVIETPAHHAILVDAGGRLERGAPGTDSQAEQVGERIVVPFLIREGVHRLDALIVSHPHGDHVGGCAPVLRKLRVAEIADGGQTYGGHAYHDCLDTAATDHVPVVQPRAGDVWHTNDGVTLHFIGPSLPFIDGKNAINDNSIAFVLTYRSFRMLFTGDAGVAAERRFLAENTDLRADVLKVGHHGSAYSSSPEFISAVHPEYAIISVGRHNLFGHPAPSTVEILAHAGAQIYGTDHNAATTIITDGAQTLTSVMVTTPTQGTSSRIVDHH